MPLLFVIFNFDGLDLQIPPATHFVVQTKTTLPLTSHSQNLHYKPSVFLSLNSLKTGLWLHFLHFQCAYLSQWVSLDLMTIHSYYSLTSTLRSQVSLSFSCTWSEDSQIKTILISDFFILRQELLTGPEENCIHKEIPELPQILWHSALAEGLSYSPQPM